MTVIYNMSIDRADKPWIGDRRLTESCRSAGAGRCASPNSVPWLMVHGIFGVKIQALAADMPVLHVTTGTS